MNREDIEKLLGGYATGTLTPEEQQALFAAALEDQALFDNLAREQALHDLLRDPAARANLLAALDAPRPRPWRWLLQPAVLTGAVAALALVTVYVVREKRPAARPAAIETAQVRQFPPPQPAAPEPKPEENPVKQGEAAHAASGAAVTASPVVPLVERKETAVKSENAPAGAPAAVEKRAEPMKDAAAPAPLAAVPPEAPGGGPATKKTADTLVIDGSLRKEKAPGGVVGGVAPGERPFSMTRDDRSAAVSAQVLFYGSAPPVQTVKTAAERGGAGGAGPRQQQVTQQQVYQALAANQVAAKALTQYLGVKWSVLRMQPDGDFTAADANDLHAGDTVKLRFETNEAGYLRIAERQPGNVIRTVSDQPVERQQPFETAPVRLEGSGSREFAVLFSRQPQAASDRLDTISARADQESSADTKERANYVVGRADSPQPVSFNIRLSYR